jgi:hypothetical protein
MDIVSSLYSFFGTSDPATFIMDLLVAVVFAVSIAYLALELYRILTEYAKKEAPVAVQKTAAAPAAPAPNEVKKPAVQEAPVASINVPAIPTIDVVKGTLSGSMVTLTQKYGLESVTLASHDGLVIASTAKAPDQDAAVYSGLFQELYKVKQEQYYYVDSKDVSLYSIDSGPSKVIGVARRKGNMSPEEIKAIRDDTAKIVDRFAPSSKKN